MAGPMKVIRSWKMLSRGKGFCQNEAVPGLKFKSMPFMLAFFTIMTIFFLYKTTKFQYLHAKMEQRLYLFNALTEQFRTSPNVDSLPRGIVEASSDLEPRPLYLSRSSGLKEDEQTHRNLLAIPAGIRQKRSVDAIVQKKILQLYYSTMMVKWMRGIISDGVTRLYTLLLLTRQSGGLPSVFCILMLFLLMTIYFYGMKIWV